MKTIILALLSLCSITTVAFAETDVPSIVTDGLKAFQKSGGKAGLAAWLKGSPVENDTTTSIGMSGLLSQVETAYGKMIGFEPVRVVSLSPSVRRVYLIMRFEKGPLYASFDCYKPAEVWIIPQVDFNTKASLVFPPALIAGSVQ